MHLSKLQGTTYKKDAKQAKQLENALSHLFSISSLNPTSLATFRHALNNLKKCVCISMKDLYLGVEATRTARMLGFVT